MANEEQLAILKQGVTVWNQWRIDNPTIKPNLNEEVIAHTDLSGYDLSGAELSWTRIYATNLHKANLNKANFNHSILSEVDFSQADLGEADFSECDLTDSDLSGANLRRADLYLADLSGTNLSDVDLTAADLYGTKLIGANLSRAILKNANLSRSNLTQANLDKANLVGAGLIEAVLVDTNLSGANLSDCRIYGISAWNVKFDGATQKNLIITQANQPIVTVDELEVAQFVYLVLNNVKLRIVIDTITTKSVLILGRFALPERKAILEAMRNKLREHGYVPILFDFEKPNSRDFTETIQVLAGMCLFVIADITNPKSSPLELQATVPNYMIPFAPIIQAGEEPFSMLADLQHKYPWMMKVRTYQDEADLIANFEKGIIHPALKRHDQLMIQKNKAPKMLAIGDDDEE